MPQHALLGQEVRCSSKRRSYVPQSLLSIMTSSVVIGGASGAADLHAVLQVAQGQAIALDVATADRIKKESPSKGSQMSMQNCESTPPIVGEHLTSVESRASVLCRLISLANGSTKLRLVVLQYLVDLLNAGVDLHLTSASADVEPLKQVAAAVAGTGLCLQDSNSVPLSEALKLHKLSPPGFTAQEHDILLSGQWVTLGVAAVCVHSAKQLLLGATAVAALSAEALQIQVSMQIACTITFDSVSSYTCMHAVHSIYNVCCTIAFDLCRSKLRWKMSMLARQQMMLSAPCQPYSRTPPGSTPGRRNH